MWRRSVKSAPSTVTAAASHHWHGTPARVTFLGTANPICSCSNHTIRIDGFTLRACLELSYQKLVFKSLQTPRCAVPSFLSMIICSTGSRSGAVYNHDVRNPRHHVGTLQGHTQEICGLAWSPDGKMLASGGNDNLVNVWDINGGCLHRLTEHRAAVKAIAWCPWQSNLLATGGGTACKSIKFWNTGRGTCINTLDTKSQISALIWNSEHREILSGHGFSENQLTIWKYPTLERVTDLVGHTERVLSMANSPDKCTVVSAGGDETLRFWNCFASDSKQKKKQRAFAASRSQLCTAIR